MPDEIKRAIELMGALATTWELEAKKHQWPSTLHMLLVDDAIAFRKAVEKLREN